MVRWIKRLLVIVSAEVLGLGLLVLLAMQALTVGVFFGMGSCLCLCAGASPVFLVLIAIHEMGHLAAGKMVGLSFSQITVGFLTLMRRENGWKARLNTSWFKPAAVVYPLLGAPTSSWRYALVVGGGPIANLLLCALCLIAASVLHPGPPDSIPREARLGWRSVALLMPGNFATASLNSAGLLSLGLGLGTLVPGRAAGVRSDGGQLLDLFWGGREANQSPPLPLIAAKEPVVEGGTP